MTSTFLSLFACSSLISITTVHSMDNPCANNGQSCTPLTRAEKEKLLDLHNELRDRVASGALASEGQPAASDMNQLLWDKGLEAVAQTYAETCPGFVHNDPDAGIEYLVQRNAGNVKWGPDNEYLSNFCGGQDCIYVGENIIAGGSTPYDVDYILQVIEGGWFNEYKQWTFGIHNEGCGGSGICGHYTQMVWANTRYIGCGYSNGCNNGRFFVCNYWPPGNFNTVPPYTSGTSCSNCMSDRTSCQSSYTSVSATASQYQEPYNALCGGGVCRTMCDGSSYDRQTCHGIGCDGATLDCNDGTRNLNRGRDICSAPTSAAPTSSTTAQPTSPTASPGEYCCRATATAGNRWTTTCPTIDNEATCLSQRRSSCEWVTTCDNGGGGSSGSCEWNGVGSKRTRACGKLSTQSECDNKSWSDGGSCQWVVGPSELLDELDNMIEFNKVNNVYLERHYDNIGINGIIYLLLIIVSMTILCLCKKCGGKEKAKHGANGEGGLIYGAIGNDAI